jgi:hypothetical protein
MRVFTEVSRCPPYTFERVPALGLEPRLYFCVGEVVLPLTEAGNIGGCSFPGSTHRKSFYCLDALFSIMGTSLTRARA